MSAGPGCRIRGDLISWIRPAATAGMACHPRRLAMRSGRTFLPHQDARLTYGRAATPAPGEKLGSFAALDRKSDVLGKSVPARVDLGGRRRIKTKTKQESM